MALLFQKDTKLICIGDSVTDAGRNYNAHESWNDAMGTGYVARFHELLDAVYPEVPVRILNRGINGNTIRDLAGRWQKDVLDDAPDYVSVMIGVNDAWRHYDYPFISEALISEDEFGRTYESLVKKTRPQVKEMILIGAFMAESNTADEMGSRVRRHAEIAQKIAQENNCIFVDTQKAFDRYLQVRYSACLTGDRVHPNGTACMLIVRELLNAVGFDWNAGR